MREIETVLVARASSGGSEESRASDRVLVWGGGAEFYVLSRILLKNQNYPVYFQI